MVILNTIAFCFKGCKIMQKIFLVFNQYSYRFQHAKCDILLSFFVQLILLVGQINLPVLTGAVYHNDGFVILTMTVVMALTSKDAPQVGTLVTKYFGQF